MKLMIAEKGVYAFVQHIKIKSAFIYKVIYDTGLRLVV